MFKKLKDDIILASTVNLLLQKLPAKCQFAFVDVAAVAVRYLRYVPYATYSSNLYISDNFNSNHFKFSENIFKWYTKWIFSKIDFFYLYKSIPNPL